MVQPEHQLTLPHEATPTILQQQQAGLENQQSAAEFMQVLQRHCIECERLGKYDEAMVTKERLVQIKRQEEQRIVEGLRARHLADRLAIEEAHMKELQDFNGSWDKTIADFESHAQSLEAALRHRQELDFSAYREKLQRDNATPRFSRELLSLRKVQQTVARQKNYSEAARIKGEADALESREFSDWKGKREERIEYMLGQFASKQDLEMGGLLKRIQSGREEQKGARKMELTRLLQRYHNVKNQLETQQNISLKRADKFSIDNSCINNSGDASRRSLNMSR